MFANREVVHDAQSAPAAVEKRIRERLSAAFGYFLQRTPGGWHECCLMNRAHARFAQTALLRGVEAAGDNRPRQELAAGHWRNYQEISMAISPLLAGAGSLPGFDTHSHHKGVHGASQGRNSADPASSSAPLGSNQHLFSHLLDSSEEMIGVNPAAAVRKP